MTKRWIGVLACVLIAASFLGHEARAGVRKPSILIVAGTFDPWPQEVQAKLVSSAQFASVDIFYARSGTPTLTQLLAYDALLLTTDSVFTNNTTLGDNLADYVDAGGGVVETMWSVGTLVPTGRWNPGYCSLALGGLPGEGPATLNTASISSQNHPILLGVGSFSGGSSSYRSAQPNVLPGATVLARWTDNSVLVAAGPFPGRVDLNFYPASSDTRADFWDTSTDGLKLMVNSLLFVCRPRILIATAEPNTAWNDDVKAKVRATGLVGITDLFRADTGTPTLEQLKGYDAVLVYSDFPGFQNASAMGNVLADYVDAGGGVVSSVFTTSATFGTARLTGRWASGYELVVGGSSQATGTATLGAVAYPSHPAMSGVASFNGGTSSYRPITTTLNPGAFNIAQWSDSKPLVVASTKFHNRVDLGFFPPSSTVDSRFWQVGTSGDKLLANALVYTIKPYVACIASDPSYIADPVAKLAASRRFSGVASIDAGSSTPAASTLKPFHSALVWSNNAFQNSTTLGNNLADFVDAGSGVVAATFANVNVNNNPIYALGGRWISQGYEIVPSPLPSLMISHAFLGSMLEPANPINAFVRKFDGGARSSRAESNPPLRGREVLRWSDGRMLASVHNTRKRVDLGFYPPSSATALGSDLWNQRTDGTWLMANALEYAVRLKPCPGDFNGDGLVDDSDFVIFLTYYNGLIDSRGDLNGDGLTDDADFSVFVGGYNDLACP